MSCCCLDAADTFTLEYCKSERIGPANDCYSANQYGRAGWKQKRLYSDMGGDDDSSLSTECWFLKDAPKKASLRCSTNSQTIFPFSRCHSDSVASLELQLDFISEGVHQLDSEDLEVPPDDSLVITLNRGALEEDLEGRKTIVTCAVTRSSSPLSASPSRLLEANRCSNDATFHIKLSDHLMPFTTYAQSTSYASLDFQLQYVAPNDPLGTCSVAPFVVFPNMHDPIFTSASYLNNRHQQTTNGEEECKGGYGWFVELDQDVFEAQTGLLSVAKKISPPPRRSKAAPQGYGVGGAG